MFTAWGEKIDYALASYPRSGNHWIRYMVEYLTRQPTLGEGTVNYSTNHDGPIFGRLGEKDFYASDKYIAIKRHNLTKQEICTCDIFLIIRNYKEIIIRASKGSVKAIYRSRYRKYFKWYMELLEAFDQCQNRTDVLYYEKLITDPIYVMNKLVIFFQLKNVSSRINKFMQNYENHKNRCIQVYNKISKSYTKGNKRVYYSKGAQRKHLLKYDEFASNGWPEIYQKYLIRYKEPSE